MLLFFFQFHSIQSIHSLDIIPSLDSRHESNKEQEDRGHCHHNGGLSVHDDQFSHHRLHSVLGPADRVAKFQRRLEAAPVDVDHPQPAAGGGEDVGGRVRIPA